MTWIKESKIEGRQNNKRKEKRKKNNQFRWEHRLGSLRTGDWRFDFLYD